MWPAASRQVIIATVVLGTALTGCGSGGSDAKTLSQQDLGNVAKAMTDVPLQCLQSGGSNDATISEDVDVLISAYEKNGPDKEFKLATNGTSVTMRKILPERALGTSRMRTGGALGQRVRSRDADRNQA